MALAEGAAGTVQRGPVLFPDRYARSGAKWAGRSAIFVRDSRLAVFISLHGPVRGGGRGSPAARRGLAVLGFVEQLVARVGARRARVARLQPFTNLARAGARRAVSGLEVDATYIDLSGGAARGCWGENGEEPHDKGQMDEFAQYNSRLRKVSLGFLPVDEPPHTG